MFFVVFLCRFPLFDSHSFFLFSSLGEGVFGEQDRVARVGSRTPYGFAVCVVNFIYPAACRQKAHGSSSAAASAAAVGFSIQPCPVLDRPDQS